MSEPLVSIVIVSYNVKQYLLKCLSSIEMHLVGISREVLVVDNNSTDGTLEMVRSSFPDVRLIVNQENTGFPAANNQAFRLASGKYIFMLNPDTELVEDSVSLLISYLEKHSEADLVAPQLLNSDLTIQSSISKFPQIRYIVAEMFYLDRFMKKKYYKNVREDIFEIDAAFGAALFFGRSLFDKIGMLNEKLFWIEDVDFCYRIGKSGGKVIYFGKTKLIHHSGQSAKKNYEVSIANQVINKIKFYKLHHDFFSLSVVYLLSIFNTFMRLIIFACISPFNRIYFLKMKAYWFTIPKIFTATNEL